MKYVKLFEEWSALDEKKPKGAPDWKDSDAPDADGRFRDLGIKDLAAWLIKTRDKDLKKISGSITQQIVFNRNEDPEYAKKMEKVRQEVYKQLGREDLMEYENFFTGKEEKDATFFPEGTMAKSAEEIFKVGMNKKYAPGGPGSAIKFITYFINRAGKGLDDKQKKELEKARDMLQKENKSGPYAE